MQTQMPDMVDALSYMGRQTDDSVGHLTRGDVVIPRDIVLQNPEFLVKLKKAMESVGSDYKSHIVGSGYESINPTTGAPEFFLKKIGNLVRAPFRSLPGPVKEVLTPVIRIAAPVIGGTFGPLGAAAGAAYGNYITGSSPSDSLQAGALAGVGNYVGGQLTDGFVGSDLSSLGSVGNSVATGIADYGGSIGGQLLASNTGAIIGSVAPSFLGASGAQQQPTELYSYTDPASQALQKELSFKPVRPSEQDTPDFLSGLTNLQKRSNIAAQGVFGGGVEQDTQKYYDNLLQRNLISDTGRVEDINGLLPVETQYLQKRGAPIGSSLDLLRYLQQG